MVLGDSGNFAPFSPGGHAGKLRRVAAAAKRVIPRIVHSHLGRAYPRLISRQAASRRSIKEETGCQ